MKDKINEFIDGRIKKEEVEELLKDPELQGYYNDIKKMKEGLRELHISNIDVLSKVEMAERKHSIFRYAFAFVVVILLIISPLFLKNYLLNQPQVSLNSEVHITRESPTFRATQTITQEENFIKIKIDRANINLLIEKLKTVSDLKEADSNSNTYTFEVSKESFKKFENTIREFYGVEILDSHISTKDEETFVIKLIIESK